MIVRLRRSRNRQTLRSTIEREREQPLVVNRTQGDEHNATARRSVSVRLQFEVHSFDLAPVGSVRSPPSRTACPGGKRPWQAPKQPLPKLEPAGITEPERRRGELGDLQPVLSPGKGAQTWKGAQSCHPADLSELLAILPARCGRRRNLKSFSSNRRHVHGRCSAHR